MVGVLAGGVLLRLLRRRKHRGRRVNDETGSVLSIGSSVQNHVPLRALESETNAFSTHGAYSAHKNRTLGLEHFLVVALLAAALGLSLRKGAYAESALVGVAALVLLVAQLARAFGRSKVGGIAVVHSGMQACSTHTAMQHVGYHAGCFCMGRAKAVPCIAQQHTPGTPLRLSSTINYIALTVAVTP